MMAERALAVHDLSIDFLVDGEPMPALRDIALDLARGDILAIVGESGSGKTTLLRALMQDLPENGRILAGRVEVAGLDLARLDRAALDRLRGRRIALVHQDAATALTPTMTIGRQIEETLIHHLGLDPAAARTRAVDALARVALPEPDRVARSWPHQLSGGMRQRAMIALALSCDPEVLLMDEPTTGLDVLVQGRILALVRELCRQSQVATLFVSHDLAAVAKLADQVGVLYAGELVELGPTAAIMEAPAHPYTRALLAALPRADRATLPTGIPGAITRGRARFAACVFRDRCAMAAAPCLTRPPVRALSARHHARCHFAEAASPVVPDNGRPAVPTTAGSPLLAIDELRIDYAGAVGLFGRHAPVRAVERASLTVAAGRSLALVGESGSGKTSIARAVLRLIRPSSGRILFRGEDIAGLSGARLRAYRQAVRVVFQNPATSLNPAHTVEALVGRTLALAGADAATVRARVSAILAAVGLDDGYRRRRPADLSGGERQRVALARAFLGEPALVVLDEPTSSLDVLVQAQVLRLLAELRARSGAAYLLISHDLAVVRQLADDVVVMREGRIVESGPVAEVIDQPRADYTKALLAAVA